MSYALTAPSADDVERGWPIFQPLLERACKRFKGEFTPQGIVERLFGDGWQLWAMHDAEGRVKAIDVTTLQTFDNGETVMTHVLCAGDGLDEGLPLHEEINEVGRMNGATKFRIYGRQGWGRTLGYEQVGVILEKADGVE